jgi:hypothetical protein
MDVFLQKYTPFIEDTAERAGKTFAQGFLAAAGVSGAATDFHSVPWVHAGQVGLVAVVFSFLTSLASLQLGTKGTASLTKAVQKSPRRSTKA